MVWSMADASGVQTELIQIYKMRFTKGTPANVEPTNSFEFNFLGKVVHAKRNFLNSCHDNKVVLASRLLLDYPSDKVMPRGRAILRDGAFVANFGIVNSKIALVRKARR